MKANHLSLFFAIGFLISTATITSAQVKIGSNPTTIDPNNNLEVEAAMPGRVTSIDKNTGKVTIKDGTEGTGKVLVSDANGTASWQTLPAGVIVLGNLATSSVSLGTVANTYVYTGTSITLPAGKWMLFVSGFMLNAGSVPANIVWHLSNSPTSLQTTGLTSISNTDYPMFIKGQTLSPNEADFNFATPQVIELAAATTLYILAADGGATTGSQAITGVNRVGPTSSGTACFYAQSVQ